MKRGSNIFLSRSSFDLMHVLRFWVAFLISKWLKKKPTSNLFRNRLPQPVSYFPHLDTGQRCYGFQETAHLSACSPQLNKGLDSWMQYQPWKCSTPAPPWLLTQSAETKNELSLAFAASEVPQRISTSWTCSKNHRSLRITEYFEVEGTGSRVQLLSGIKHTVAPNLNETKNLILDYEWLFWVLFLLKSCYQRGDGRQSLQQAKVSVQWITVRSDFAPTQQHHFKISLALEEQIFKIFDRDLVFTNGVCSAWHDV